MMSTKAEKDLNRIALLDKSDTGDFKRMLTTSKIPGAMGTMSREKLMALVTIYLLDLEQESWSETSGLLRDSASSQARKTLEWLEMFGAFSVDKGYELISDTLAEIGGLG